MSWLALTLVAFVCFVLVFFIKNRQLNHPALQYPYRLKVPLFASAERELLEHLQGTFGERYLVLPKVSVADVIVVTAIPRRAYWYQASNRIAAARFDFLLCTKTDLQPVCVINLDEPESRAGFHGPSLRKGWSAAGSAGTGQGAGLHPRSRSRRGGNRAIDHRPRISGRRRGHIPCTPCSTAAAPLRNSPTGYE